MFLSVVFMHISIDYRNKQKIIYGTQNEHCVYTDLFIDTNNLRTLLSQILYLEHKSRKCNS